MLGTVPGDVWQPPIETTNSFQGQAVYAFNSRELPFQRYLVLRNINGSQKPTGVKNADVVTYPIEGIAAPYDLVYQPQFSPDGRHVLFKIGDPYERQGAFALFIWDIETQNIKQVMGYLKYQTVLWSPDGNYFACVGDGDIEGNTEEGETLELYLQNWRSGKGRDVVKNNAVRGSFSWAAPHTLLYSALSKPGRKASGGNISTIGRFPALYAATLEGTKPQLVAKDGYRPVASPDGKCVTFFGSENLTKPIPLTSVWEFNPQGRALSIIKQDGTGRKTLNREDGSYPAIQWLPDSRKLLTLKVVQPSPNAVAQIREWDILTGRVRNVGELSAKDYEPIIRIDTQPQFQPLGISKDASSFFIRVTEFIGREPKGPFLIALTSVKAVDLQSGAVSTVARIKGVLDLDWYDEDPRSSQ